MAESIGARVSGRKKRRKGDEEEEEGEEDKGEKRRKTRASASGPAASASASTPAAEQVLPAWALKDEDRRKFHSKLVPFVKHTFGLDDAGAEKKLSRVFLRKPVDWFTLHKIVTIEFKGSTSLIENAEFGRKYMEIEGRSKNDMGKNVSAEGKRLKKLFEDLDLNDFEFRHTSEGITTTTSNAASPGVEKWDEISEEDADPSEIVKMVAQKVATLEKMIMKGKRSLLSELKSRIADVNTKGATIGNVDSEFMLLFYGRTGAGKSTLINMLLFVSCFEEIYKKKSSEAETMECLSLLENQWREDGIPDNISDEAKALLQECIDGEEDRDMPEECKGVSVISRSDVLNEEGRWTNDEEREQEKKDLFEMIHPIGNRDIKPFILDSPTENIDGSCTAHAIEIRYGSRWQAVITYFTLDEIMNIVFPDNAVPLSSFKDKQKQSKAVESNLEYRHDMLKAICTFEDHMSEEKFESLFESDDAPSSRDDGMKLISQEAVQRFETRRVDLIVGMGQHMTDDRMFVRQSLKTRLLDPIQKMLVKKVALFAPSVLLKTPTPMCWVDAPGIEEANVFNQIQLSGACEKANGVVWISRTGLGQGGGLDAFFITFGDKLLGRKKFPAFVVIRLDNDKIDSLEKLEEFQKKPKKSKENVKKDSLKDLKEKILWFLHNESKRPKEEKDRLEEILNSFSNIEDMFKGGTHLFIRPALLALCEERSKEKRSSTFEKSSFKDLIIFLTEVSENQALFGETGLQLKRALNALNEAKHRLKNKNAIGEKLVQHYKSVKSMSDKYDLYYAFKKNLGAHPLFCSVQIGQKTGMSSSQSSQSVQMEDSDLKDKLFEWYQQLAKDLSQEILDSLKGENFIALMDAGCKLLKNENDFRVAVTSTEGNAKNQFQVYTKMVKPCLKRELFKNVFESLEKDVYPEFVECGCQTLKESILGQNSTDQEIEEYLDKEIEKVKEKIETDCINDFKHENGIFLEFLKRAKKNLTMNLFESVRNRAKGKAFNSKVWFEHLRDEILNRFSEVGCMDLLRELHEEYIIKKSLNNVARVFIVRSKPLLEQYRSWIIQEADSAPINLSPDATKLLDEIKRDLEAATEVVKSPENDELFDILSLNHQLKLLRDTLFHVGRPRLGEDFERPKSQLGTVNPFEKLQALMKFGETVDQFRSEKISLKVPTGNSKFQSCTLIPHLPQPWCRTRLDFLLCAILSVLQKQDSEELVNESNLVLLRNLLIKKICATYLDDSTGFTRKFEMSLSDYIGFLQFPLEEDRPKRSVSVLPVLEAFTTLWGRAFIVEVVFFPGRGDEVKKENVYRVVPNNYAAQENFLSFKFAMDGNGVFYGLRKEKDDE